MRLNLACVAVGMMSLALPAGPVAAQGTAECPYPKGYDLRDTSDATRNAFNAQREQWRQCTARVRERQRRERESAPSNCQRGTSNCAAARPM
jgi:hypothetical protein